MRLPADAIGPAGTIVYFAVVRLHERQVSMTVRDVAAETGYSLVHIYNQLLLLRDAGLVDWTTGRSGTLHPVPVVTSVPSLGPAGATP